MIPRVSLEDPKIRVLMIDDDDDDHVLIKKFLSFSDPSFELERVVNLQDGIDYLTRKAADVVILDLHLPDSRGLSTFNRLRSLFKDIPIVIMSSLDDEKSALDAVQNGADDYLVKGNVDGARLSRVLKYSMRRQEVRREVMAAGLKDTLTGLYNREGFFLMADQHIKLSRRADKGFSACFFVLNNWEEIVKMLSYQEGDYALMAFADVLKDCFRDTDIVGRIGQDEFAVLMWEESLPKQVADRIRKNQKFRNAQFNQYKLSLSMCVSHFDPSQPQAIRDLAAKADKLLSAHKTKNTNEELVLAESTAG